MSMCVLGMAEEFKAEGVAVNALWPRTAIATAAVVRSLHDEFQSACTHDPLSCSKTCWVVMRP